MSQYTVGRPQLIMRTSAGRIQEEGNTYPRLREYKLVPPLQKSVWMFLKTLEIDLQHDPAILFLGTYPKDSPSYYRYPCLLLLYSQQPGNGNSPGIHQLMNGQ